MAYIVAWIALGISSILAIVEIVKLVKYWQKPKIELVICLPHGKLSEIEGKKFSDISVIVTITNKGNEDTFIEELSINHHDKSRNGNVKSTQWIATGFKLAKDDRKSFDVKFSHEYKPNRNNRFEEEVDSVYVKAVDKKRREYIDVLYYGFPGSGGIMIVGELSKP